VADVKRTGRRTLSAGRYREGTGGETEFEPGSRGKVLRHVIGICREADLLDAELALLHQTYQQIGHWFSPDHRFTEGDIRTLHRMWLGPLFSWAGQYRSVDISKGGFRFAVPRLIPGPMKKYSTEILGRVTPCSAMSDEDLAAALAEAHAEPILIPPFREGNGRIARLLADAMAAQRGFSRLVFHRWEGDG
jgi:cell filamentation protein